MEPSAKGGWNEARRRPFTVIPLDSQDKTEAYDIFRRPKGHLHWTDPDRKPVAGLEIYRPRGEEEAGPAIADIAARMAPDGAREIGAAGVIAAASDWPGYLTVLPGVSQGSTKPVSGCPAGPAWAGTCRGGAPLRQSWRRIG